MPINNVTVYCAASSEIDPAYLIAARATGRAIALAGWNLVYGGNRTGCMHEVAEGARSAKGKVIGITPQLFVDKGIHDADADELVITPGMRERKLLLEQRADAFLTLPGGLGTYEELFEQLVNRQLKVHDKPIVALNQSDYFRPLQDLIAHGIQQGFMKPRARELIQFADTVEEAISFLKSPHHVTARIESLSHEAAAGR